MEQPLLPNEACTLGSINLRNMLKKKDEGKYILDLEKLKYTARLGTHFLDNVVDMSTYPTEEIKEMARKYRKIGLGIMGWAHMLYLLKIPYNSEAALMLAEYVMGIINIEARNMSEELAVKRGSFPGIDRSIYNGKNMRNATVTTAPPTGSLSIIASTSAGIEPEFALAYVRNSADEELGYVNWIFDEEYQKITGNKKGSDEYNRVMRLVAKKGTLEGIDGIPEELRKIFVTAHDVEVEYHVRMQASFQRYIDNAVSKTTNLSHDATEDDVEKVYILARESGCKGITIYRDGSRENQTLMIGSEKKEVINEEIKEDKEEPIHTYNVPRERPDITTGYTKKVKIGCGNLYVTVNKDERGICEVFTNTGRAGGCPSQSEATARLISIALRSGVSVPEIVEQLKGIRCPSTVRQKGLEVTSCPDAIAKLIEYAYNNDTVKLCTETNLKTCEDCSSVTTCTNTKIEHSSMINHTETSNGAMSIDASKFTTNCPECGVLVEHEGGCVSCRNCGWGKCG